MNLEPFVAAKTPSQPKSGSVMSRNIVEISSNEDLLDVTRIALPQSAKGEVFTANKDRTNDNDVNVNPFVNDEADCVVGPASPESNSDGHDNDGLSDFIVADDNPIKYENTLATSQDNANRVAPCLHHHNVTVVSSNDDISEENVVDDE
ncbi:hypothetical protein C0993_002802 [Termitomyces sp. T159_Od127]|nr:hypothetical protein C0993_002802 [Termitomyces sp. T159_Od127]